MVTRRKKRKSKTLKRKGKKSKHFIIKTRRNKFFRYTTGGQDPVDFRNTYGMTGNAVLRSTSNLTEITKKGWEEIASFYKKHRSEKDDNPNLFKIYKYAWDIIFLVDVLNTKKVFDAFYTKKVFDAFYTKEVRDELDIKETIEFDAHNYYYKYQELQKRLEISNQKEKKEETYLKNQGRFSKMLFTGPSQHKRNSLLILAEKRKLIANTHAVIDFLHNATIKLIKIRYYLDDEIITKLEKSELEKSELEKSEFDDLVSTFKEVLTTLYKVRGLIDKSFGIIHDPPEYPVYQEIVSQFEYKKFRELLGVYVVVFDFIRTEILKGSSQVMEMQHTSSQEEFLDEKNLPENFLTDQKYELVVY